MTDDPMADYGTDPATWDDEDCALALEALAEASPDTYRTVLALVMLVERSDVHETLQSITERRGEPAPCRHILAKATEGAIRARKRYHAAN